MNVNADEILLKLYKEPHLYESKLSGYDHPIAKKGLAELIDQEESYLMWFKMDDLWLRSDRLRPIKEPSKISTKDNPDGYLNGRTASIHDIAITYTKNYLFNSDPILVHYEQIKGKTLGIVYEGRHRVVGAELAKRPFILGRLISSQHSTVSSQKDPGNKKYYQKPVYHITKFTDMFMHNKEV